MIIAFTSGGQMGNQLMYAANMMASSLQCNIPYKNISFKAIDSFEINDVEQRKSLCYRKGLQLALTKYMYGIKKMLRVCGERAPGINVFLDKEDEAKAFFLNSHATGINLFHCWPYLDLESLYKQQNRVRDIIKPKEEYLEIGKCRISEIRRMNKDVTIVGVHVRRNDYKDFLGGFYYFDLDVYRKRMEEMSRIVDGNVLFLVFSDESIDKDLLSQKGAHYRILFSKNLAMVDLVMMGMCDYIIGPPSTFSGWASFWGNVPKHIMLNENTGIKSLKSDFGVYMIDLMDNETDDAGRKRLSFYRKGKKVTLPDTMV